MVFNLNTFDIVWICTASSTSSASTTHLRNGGKTRMVNTDCEVNRKRANNWKYIAINWTPYSFNAIRLNGSTFHKRYGNPFMKYTYIIRVYEFAKLYLCFRWAQFSCYICISSCLNRYTKLFLEAIPLHKEK